MDSSRRLLQTIMSNTRNLVYVRDLDGRFTLVNGQLCRAFGLAEDAIVGKTPFDICPQEAARAWLAEDHHVAEAAASLSVREDLPLPDGRHEYLSTKFPVHDGKGRVNAVGSVMVDITDQVSMEAALRSNEEKFRLAFHTVPLAININRLTDGAYVDVNEGFTRLMGYTPQDVIGKSSLDLNIWVDPADRERLVAGLARSGFAENLRARFRRKSGDVGIGVMSARVMKLGGESVILSVTRDITEEVELQEKFVQAQKMEAFGRLAGGVAHDFNNLLVPIIAYAEQVRDTLVETDDRRRMMDEILSAAMRAASLTRQILTFSRKQVMDLKPADLNKLIADFQKMIERLLGETIVVRVFPGALSGSVRVDRLQIEQVLLNLAVNARDAMPGGGVLTITTGEETLQGGTYGSLEDEGASGRYAFLSVSDTGHGMDAETRKHLFEPFFTTKPQGKGTGLGLATVFGIARQHHGHVRVASQPGKGSTFTVYLPLSSDEALPDECGSSGMDVLRGSEAVLVVEDDEHVRNLICDALRRHGYAVIASADAESAIRAAAECSAEKLPRVLLTDVIMPGMNGMELFSRMSRNCPGLKSVFMSGYSENVIAHHGQLDEGIDLLQKPFTSRELLRKIRSVLDRQPGGLP